MSYYLKIYETVSGLPENWNSVVGNHNVMLSEEYFNVLEDSSPYNMKCFFMGFFLEDELIGGALFQYLNFKDHRIFRNKKEGFKIKNFIVKCFVKDVMILGNNMLTGQNGFYFDFSRITVENAVVLLENAARKMQNEISKTSFVIFKDYQLIFASGFQNKSYRNYFTFSAQPNMMLKIRENWNNFEDYTNDLTKKYRARIRSARNKMEGIEKRELNSSDIQANRLGIWYLYRNVAENAPFNTFFLSENHFEKMKENLKDKFKVYGYFSGEKLIGFYTIILNNKDIFPYFLGYDEDYQKEKQLYLNMLVDMVEFAINEKKSKIIFGRTALEIKSTVGAEPVEIFGLFRHNNVFINAVMKNIVPSFTPKTDWIQRKPFK
ncbi:peptidogalycan biosysnthesis protein [Chryseobacterium lineare]